MTQNLNLYTMQTLFEQPVEPVDFIVDGLLAPGLYILGGSPKVGKSWLALQLCLAVCGGTSFLGRATHQSEVLYLALEDGPQRLHSRALRLTQTAPAGLYLCGQALPVGQGLEQQLEHTLDEHPGIRLVILDTLQKVRCVTGSGMSYGADYQDAAALKSIADRYHVCLLAIHHLRKLPDEDPFNRLSGTNGLTGAADGTLILVRPKRQENMAVLTATGRDIEDQEETLEFAIAAGTERPTRNSFSLACLSCCCKNCFGKVRFKALRLSWLAGKRRAALRAGTVFPIPPEPWTAVGRSGNRTGSEPHQQQKNPAALAW